MHLKEYAHGHLGLTWLKKAMGINRRAKNTKQKNTAKLISSINIQVWVMTKEHLNTEEVEEKQLTNTESERTLGCLKGDSQNIHTIIFTDSVSLLQKMKSGMGSLDWDVLMFDIHLEKLLWMYCPGHARVKGNDWEDMLAGKAAITSSSLLRSLVLRSLRHYMLAQSQGHHTINCLEERCVERGSTWQSFLKRIREGHHQSDEHWNHFKGKTGKTSEI